jgi:hypothetical protein
MHERHSRARARHVIEAYDGGAMKVLIRLGYSVAGVCFADRLLRSELSCRKRGNVNGVYDTVR